jgi:hypothetical protein
MSRHWPDESAGGGPSGGRSIERFELLPASRLSDEGWESVEEAGGGSDRSPVRVEAQARKEALHDDRRVLQYGLLEG